MNESNDKKEVKVEEECDKNKKKEDGHKELEEKEDPTRVIILLLT